MGTDDNKDPALTADDLAHLKEVEDVDGTAGEGDKGEIDVGDGKGAAGKGAGEGEAGEGDKGDPASWPTEGFPDDWRERVLKPLGLTGESLKKAQEKAKRASSPAELMRSVLAADSKISEAAEQLKGRVKIPTGKKDDPKEVEAFDKAWGVPEAADKYALPEPPKELGERTEFDKEIIGEALKDFHGAKFNQRQVDTALKAFDRAQMVVKRQIEEQAKNLAESAEEDLRAEYLRDYVPNVELANRFLERNLGQYLPDKAERHQLLSMQLKDGTSLGDWPPFVKMVVNLAKAAADDGDMIAGESREGVDVDKRVDEITKLAGTNPAEYAKLEPELRKLIRVQEARAKKGAR